MESGRSTAAAASAGRMSELSDDSGSIMTADQQDDVFVGQFPDWQTVDEISIKLLEQGVGAYETLQRALPSIVLAKIDKIKPIDNAEDEEDSCCSEKRLVKLFRLAQLEIDYLLRTQTDLLENLTKERNRSERLSKENKIFRSSILTNSEGAKGSNLLNSPTAQKTFGSQQRRELFKCQKCSKIFLHVAFLIDHIKRKHASNLEAAAGSAFFSDVSQKGRCEMGENLSSTESFLIPAVNDDRTKKYKLNGQVVPMLWKIPSAADRSLSEATSLPLWHDV